MGGKTHQKQLDAAGGPHPIFFPTRPDVGNAGTYQLFEKPSDSYHTSLLAFIFHAVFFPPRFMISD